MKTMILFLLAGILPLNFSIAQETPEFEPYWHCNHNSVINDHLKAVQTEDGFSCWAQCEPPPQVFESPLGSERIHACLDLDISGGVGLAARACEASLGPVTPCLPSSSGGGGGSDSSTKALIAGGVAIAAVAVVKFLAPPETPDGVSIRPKANIAFRDGVAVSTAGLLADWRNWEVAAVSANAGEGWTKPYARVQWTWVF